jgi:hypothetical protein
MDPRDEARLHLTRREFLGRTSTGIGTAALATLLGQDLLAASASGLPGLPHFAPRAKRVIYLMQSGAPSHVDLFDYKPQMEKLRGQEIPDSVTRGQRLTTMTSGQKSKPVLPPITGFRRCGQSGATVCNF